MNMNMKARFFLLAVAIVAASSCCRAPQPKPIKGVEHVVFIGLDGMSSVGFETGEMPFIKSLLPDASYTTKKRSVLPSSSAINWITMFSASCPELHGYTTWGSKSPELPSRVILKNNIYPTVFQVYRDKYPEAEMGCMYDWDGIKYLVDSLSFSYHSQTVGGEPDDVVSLCSNACDYVSQKNPDMTVVVFDNPDSEGHAFGWCSPEYMEALTKLDKAVESIFAACEKAGITRENSIFVITSDHGGINNGHGGMTMDEMETPFIILGKGVKKGYCFDDISMMQFDVASTIARIHALEQPQPWIGRPMPVFEGE